MIGQRELLNRIDGQIRRDRFPRFTILIGEKGSGKKELSKYIADNLGATIWIAPDIKVDTIREVIDNCYKVSSPVVYVIPDCDTLSSSAANALLKVVEEPPKAAYFILTCENENNLLPTIRSRGVTYMLEPYSYTDKCDYINQMYDMNKWSDEETEFALETATTPGDIDYMWNTDLPAFIDFVNLVIDHIAEVQIGNAFKIGDRIALKDEEDKYSLRLFWKAFTAMCADKLKKADEPLKYARASAITGECARELNIKGTNKQMLFDTWIFLIREEWI